MRRKLQKKAAEQHGVVARRQLRDWGFSGSAIDRLIRSGWLHSLHRGVFAVGHDNVSIEGHWMAAVLFAGDGAVLSHSAAAGLWEISTRSRHAHVTTGSPRRSRPGITFHTSLLPFDEVTTHNDIPVTTPHRTTFDLASIRRRESVEAAINRSDYLQLPDTLGLPTLLERHPRAPGAATIKAILQAGVIPDMRSWLEEEFVAFLRARGLPLPEMNVEIEWAPGRVYRPDCLWREAKLIVELDGGKAHRTEKAFHADPLRDRRLRLLGYETWRVTGQHLDDELEAQLRMRLVA